MSVPFKVRRRWEMRSDRLAKQTKQIRMKRRCNSAAIKETIVKMTLPRRWPTEKGEFWNSVTREELTRWLSISWRRDAERIRCSSRQILAREWRERHANEWRLCGRFNLQTQHPHRHHSRAYSLSHWLTDRLHDHSAGTLSRSALSVPIELRAHSWVTH